MPNLQEGMPSSTQIHKAVRQFEATVGANLRSARRRLLRCMGAPKVHSLPAAAEGEASVLPPQHHPVCIVNALEMLLPISLFVALPSFLLFAQAQQQLSLDTVVDLDSSKLQSPPSFKLPSDSNPLYVSIALCANSDSPPRFFVTNDTTFTQPGPGDVDNVNVFEVIVGSEGFGSWTGMLANGGILSIQKGSTTTPFEVLVSANSMLLRCYCMYISS